MHEGLSDSARSISGHDILERAARRQVLDALSDTRIVLVAGARQVGKSTLVRGIAASEHPAAIVDLDDDAARGAAQRDPAGFVAGLEGAVVIDEIQRAPELLLAIKAQVDRDPRPGRFLLTGSADVFASRQVIDTLAGRIETVRLWPLTQAEIHGTDTNLVDALFAASPPRVRDAPVGRAAFVKAAAAGGYPEARSRPAGRRRDRWFANYVDATLTSEVREIADVVKLSELPRLLRLLATQSAGELVSSSLADRLELDGKTIRSYVGLLEAVFLVKLLPAWRPGLGLREIHRPKAYVVDSGLLAHLLGANGARIGEDDQVTGRVLESFVAMEVLRHADVAAVDARVHHYRHQGAEVDLVLEDRAGDVAAVEVKATATIRPRDYAGLAKLRDALGDRFRAGFVVCCAAQTTPLGDRLWAVPVSGLWDG
jgi:predicted AAA+ superfamily ATPase